ncbi:MAG: Spi family protease inhibitor [Bacteroidota bacterium]|nr:Spi family protease inhibitor [Bacteroidota bacterium]
MRRKINTILILLLLVVSVYGKPVTLTEVQQVVYALLGDWNKQLDIKKIEEHYLPTGELGFYIVDLGQGGWVIVSADDVIRPVLAFSFENKLTPVNEWEGAAAYLLEIYQKEISIAIHDSSLDRVC